MPKDTRHDREAAIAEAAYALLEEKGFKGASMLAIAKRARASNETLYRWYGDKLGLCRALIAANAAEVEAKIDADFGGPAEAHLQAVAETLLAMLLSPRAISINRAAAADPSGVLGAALADAGRSRVLPKLARIIARLHDTGRIRPGDVNGQAARFVDLLVGDLQIRRATGAMAPIDHDAICARADRATKDFLWLESPERQAP